MKIKILFSLLIVSLVSVSCGLIRSTVTPQQGYPPSSPYAATSNVVYVPPSTNYFVSPQVNEISNIGAAYIPIAQSVLSATPIAPAAVALPKIYDGFFAALAGVLGLIAAYKNRQSNNHAAAAASMAATIVGIEGATGNALQMATNNNSVSTVAQHLADAKNPVQL